VILGVGAMERSATWYPKKPTVQEIVEIYMSRSGYFNRSHKFFPRVSVTQESVSSRNAGMAGG